MPRKLVCVTVDDEVIIHHIYKRKLYTQIFPKADSFVYHEFEKGDSKTVKQLEALASSLEADDKLIIISDTYMNKSEPFDEGNGAWFISALSKTTNKKLKAADVILTSSNEWKVLVRADSNVANLSVNFIQKPLVGDRNNCASGKSLVQEFASLFVVGKLSDGLKECVSDDIQAHIAAMAASSPSSDISAEDAPIMVEKLPVIRCAVAAKS